MTFPDFIRHDETGAVIAETFPASQDAVDRLLAAPVDADGRSEWTWLRLANGDLMLGLFPAGETYFDLELAVEADYKAAEAAATEGDSKAGIGDTVERLADDGRDF